jgi:hypothetical protein
MTPSLAMPLSLQIDRCHRRVVTRATGAVTETDFLAIRREMSASRSFDSHYSLLLDLREATDLQLSPVAVADMVRTSGFALGTVHAILGTTELQLDVAHMLAAISRSYHRCVRVFRDADDADRWLSDVGAFGARRRGDGAASTMHRRTRLRPRASKSAPPEHALSDERCSGADAQHAPTKIAIPKRNNPLLVGTPDGSTFACWVESIGNRPHWAFITRDLKRLRGPRYQNENTLEKIHQMVSNWRAQPAADDTREQ